VCHAYRNGSDIAARMKTTIVSFSRRSIAVQVRVGHWRRHRSAALCGLSSTGVHSVTPHRPLAGERKLQNPPTAVDGEHQFV
jgi:hypothetical protein